jgi:lipid A oxidase
MNTKVVRAVRGRAKYTAAVCLISALFIAGTTRAELRVSVYSGVAETLDADVKLEQQGETVLTFDDVMWDDESLTAPIYYGLRLTYWFHRAVSWGLLFDFTQYSFCQCLHLGRALKTRLPCICASKRTS